ncbi:MAG: hypothetical protein ACRD3W_05365, partial [Terriglobales bacterium]
MTHSERTAGNPEEARFRAELAQFRSDEAALHTLLMADSYPRLPLKQPVEVDDPIGALKKKEAEEQAIFGKKKQGASDEQSIDQFASGMVVGAAGEALGTGAANMGYSNARNALRNSETFDRE